MADTKTEFLHLRKTIPSLISSLETGATIVRVCQELGLPHIEFSGQMSKAQYVSILVREANDQVVVDVAKRIISAYPGTRSQPNEETVQVIQDSVWWIENDGQQIVSNVVRFEVAEQFETLPFWGRSAGLQDFFSSANFYIKDYAGAYIGSDGFLYQDRSSISSILDDFIFPSRFSAPKQPKEPPVKITVFSFLKYIGIGEWPDQRFILFLERVIHPEIQKLEDQEKVLQQLSPILERDGFEFCYEQSQGGSPVYKIRKKARGVQGAPKYIIFAPIGLKPDIVLTDALNMDIQIVKDEDKIIVYDQPPPTSDLTWDMLIKWWCKKNNLDSNSKENRKKFGYRLRNSLQSDPERMVFDSYFKGFMNLLGDKLPALLPQVYLHYDPRAQRDREKLVLFRQRMDFLMLLRNSIRIIIEIDGIQHYSDEDRIASPKKYADMVTEDRRIKLLGYEVYRFGGLEFVEEEKANNTVINFFTDLFERHEIKP